MTTTHYKVICISMYTRDLKRLDEIVHECKRRGHKKMNRSMAIRDALARISADILVETTTDKRKGATDESA